MTTVFEKYSDRFNKSSDSKPASNEDVIRIEKALEILLPTDYKQFLQEQGDVWTPDILDIIVDKEIDLNDVQQFWDSERIIYDKQNEWTSKVSVDIIPFASDCMGNIFAFKTSDLKTQRATADIYFFDHDFDIVEKVSDSFTKWLDNYNEI